MVETEQASASKPPFRWPAPGRGLRMEALDAEATVGYDRAEMNEPAPARAGELRIRSLAYGRITSLEQARRWKNRRDAHVPVFAVDGRPVAAGYGTIAMPIGPGPHIVTVQTQDSEEDCCTSMAVDGDRGAALDYVAPYFSWRSAPEIADVSMHGRFGPAGLLPAGWPSDLDGGSWRGAVLAAVAAAFVAGVAVALLGPPSSPALTATAVTVPALAVGAATGLTLGRRRRGLLATARGSEPPHRPPAAFGEPGDGLWHGSGGMSPRDPSRALVVVRQALRQWTDPVPETPLAGDDAPLPQTKCFTPPPRLRVGERSLAGWGVWTVEVPPGRHRVEAAVGAAEASHEVAVEPGGVAEVELTVRMERRWSGPGADSRLVSETPVLAFATGRSRSP